MNHGKMAATTGEASNGSSGSVKPFTPKGRWYFSKEDLATAPSIKMGLQMAKELSYRQQGANFIQDMGQHLRV